MSSDWSPLVTAIAPDGLEVAVCRDERGALWLGMRVAGDRWGGTLLARGAPAWTGGEGWSAAGGALPAGAVAVEARHRDGAMRPATAGAGAWVAIVDGPVMHGTFPVRCLDDDGRVVPRPAHGEDAGPVPDAGVACPACESADWELRVWDEHRAVRCRACGHDVPMGMFYAAAPADEPTEDELAAWRAEADQELARQIAFVLEGLRFPLYGPAARPAALEGHATHNGMLCSVTLREGAVTVETTQEDFRWPRADTVREAYADQLRDAAGEEWPDLSEPALSVWLDAQERRFAELAARAPLERVALAVDGRQVSFLHCGDASTWAAATRAGALQILVTATGVAPGNCALARLDRLGSSPLPAAARWDPDFI